MTAANARERTPISDAVAAQIRAERAAAGLSQESVFTTAGISKSAYLKLESGRNVADISQLAGICAALGLDLPTFFERATARKDASATLGEHVISQLSPQAQAGVREAQRIIADGKAKRQSKS